MRGNICYCTNIHPAESWEETFTNIQTHTLKVREFLLEKIPDEQGEHTAYPIGLRLSARAAKELLTGEHLHEFKFWLYAANCYVYTINGFPYGEFHQGSLKEQVFAPDWGSQERLLYTANLATILSELCPPSLGGSLSTLPASHKSFDTTREDTFANLYASAKLLHKLSEDTGKDLHLGLEPEPFGLFENTAETLQFFEHFHTWAQAKGLDTKILKEHIGITYDTCHFALQYEEPEEALQAFNDAGIRISKVQLSNALELQMVKPADFLPITYFDEATYLHQVIFKDSTGTLIKCPDISACSLILDTLSYPVTARVHFHIPLDRQPTEPLSNTIEHTERTIAYLIAHPSLCAHLEIETYTWHVLPGELKLSVEEQITNEHVWCDKQLLKHSATA